MWTLWSIIYKIYDRISKLEKQIFYIKNVNEYLNFFHNLVRRYTYTWLAIIVIACLQFQFNFLRIDDKTLLNDLFGQDVLDTKC